MNESPRSIHCFGTNSMAPRAASEGQSLAREERFTVEAHVDVCPAVEDVDTRASVQPVVARLSVDLETRRAG